MKTQRVFHSKCLASTADTIKNTGQNPKHCTTSTMHQRHFAFAFLVLNPIPLDKPLFKLRNLNTVFDHDLPSLEFLKEFGIQL